MEKLVTFYSEGQKIFANLHLPREGAPCIVMSHGFESSKDGDKWLLLAPMFYDVGFASLRFSYRGCGEGDEKSQGEFEDTTLTGRIKDYEAALDYLQTTEVDRSRLGVIGSSFGGEVALAAKDSRIKAMVTMATPSRPFSPTQEQLRSYEERGYFVLPSGRRLKRGTSSDTQRYDICQAVKKIHCPILTIHGSLDEVVPVDNAYELYSNANEPKRLEIIEGGNHVFDAPQHIERVITLSLEWFKRYL